MNRPWVIWLVLGTCGLLILGAMGWLTQHVLRMEEERAASVAEADLEERVRLALSRMDTAASSFLLAENQRPPAHYEAFFRPADVFTNQFQNVEPGVVLQPSPLLGETPEFVRLNFELATDRRLKSPQVPAGNQRDLAESSGIPAAFLNQAATDLAALRTLLAQPVEGSGAQAGTNLDQFCLACAPATVTWNEVQAEEVNQAAAVVKGNWGFAQQTRVSRDYQKDLALAEKGKRAQVYEQALNKAADASGKSGGVTSRAKAPDTKNAPARKMEIPAAEADALAGAPAEAAPKVDTQSGVTPFQPVWLGGELFAVREVRKNGMIRYQGLWLKAPELCAHLLATSDDLLPGAALQPVEALAVGSIPGAFRVRLEELQADPRALVTLPWRLVPGETAILPVLGWTPLRVSLTVGWVAVLLALLAAAALVRGVMKMSDRRAAFVSSVTHELRTPLTTFQLYSDMLADGMVPSETKRQEYLGTLRTEAGRLNHLIENVLAYSRIERGSARARHEKVPLSELLERFRPRLEERVGTEGARLEVVNGEKCDGMKVDTDVTAVEQIVFNLVDNACKYGMPEEGPGVVRVRALNGGNRARIEVSDEGGGVARRDRKKLFQPFHKSAKDAAHSKPGVGLGLALCKRLARALGGDLRVDGGREKGACFILELPAARS